MTIPIDLIQGTLQTRLAAWDALPDHMRPKLPRELRQLYEAAPAPATSEARYKELSDRCRAIKVLTPGRYDLHAWVDSHRANGPLIDQVYLILESGGILISGVPA